MKNQIIFKKQINLQEENYFFNRDVYDTFEVEYSKYTENGLTQNVLGFNISTNGSFKRNIKICFEFDKSGEYDSSIEISTNYYSIKGKFDLNDCPAELYSPDYSAIFRDLCENDQYYLSNLYDMVSLTLIPYIVKEEADIRFYSEKQRLSLLEKSLDLYTRSINCDINEMTARVNHMDYIMSTEAMACYGHEYDSNVARPFGASRYIENEVKEFNLNLEIYNDIFKDVLEGVHLKDYLFKNTFNFEQVYADVNTTLADRNEKSKINYFVLNDKGVYLANRLNYTNPECLDIKKFIENNKYDILVDDVDFNVSVQNFETSNYPIYHIGDNKDNYIELHIKESETDYLIKVGKDTLGYQQMSISKEDLEDKFIVFDNKGYTFSNKVILNEDNTFEFEGLEENYIKECDFDSVQDMYIEERIEKSIEYLKLSLTCDDEVVEEKVYAPTGVDPLGFLDIDDEDIPF